MPPKMSISQLGVEAGAEEVAGAADGLAARWWRGAGAAGAGAGGEVGPEAAGDDGAGGAGLADAGLGGAGVEVGGGGALDEGGEEGVVEDGPPAGDYRRRRRSGCWYGPWGRRRGGRRKRGRERRGACSWPTVHAARSITTRDTEAQRKKRSMTGAIAVDRGRARVTGTGSTVHCPLSTGQPQAPSAGATGHSYRSASMGSRREAFQAGRSRRPGRR